MDINLIKTPLSWLLTSPSESIQPSLTAHVEFGKINNYVRPSPPINPEDFTSKEYVDNAIIAAQNSIQPPDFTAYVKKDGSSVITDNPILKSSALTLDNEAVSKDYVDTVAGGISMTSNLIVKLSTNITPTGYLRVNGATLAQASYPALYALIGTQYNIADYAIPSFLPWKQQYEFNTTQVNDITSWSNGTDLPIPIIETNTVVTKNRVYLLGGFTTVGGNFTTIYNAPIDSSGVVGTWSAVGSLPVALALASIIVTKNRVYLVGGIVGGVNVNTVYTAPINSDGTLGSWTTETAFPINSSIATVVMTSTRAYIIGGASTLYSSSISSIYYANINSDGTLGAWTTAAAYPTTISGAVALVTKNRVYICGGSLTYSTGTAAVYTAPIDVNGVIGTWTASGNLSHTAVWATGIVTKNRAYIFGGYNQGVSSTAPIDSNGVIGTWVAGTALPTAMSLNVTIITSSRVYILGKYQGTAALANVYYASFTGGFNDYSNVGAITPGTPAGSFVLPDLSADDALTPGFYSYIKI